MIVRQENHLSLAAVPFAMNFCRTLMQSTSSMLTAVMVAIHRAQTKRSSLPTRNLLCSPKNVAIMQRPGPRLVEGLRCVAQIVHPEKFTVTVPDYCSVTV